MSTAYDEVEYPGHAYPDTHPDRLATVAHLHGLAAPPVERCRVLDIGCGDGGNLIAMAIGLPNAEFVGIDLAATPVSKGNDLIAQLGLNNVRLVATDLMAWNAAEFGEFDYIIAHGFYSWIPPVVRGGLLRVCATSLRANGVAFISYNTYPAGHIREMARNLMLSEIAASDASEASDRVTTGRAALAWMASAAPEGIGQTVWQYASKTVNERNPQVLFHDDLALEHYHPVYFRDFAAEITEAGLQFLAEATITDIVRPTLDPAVAAEIERRASGDVVRSQQLLDFAQFNGFRESLICHRDVVLARTGLAARVAGLLVASSLQVVSGGRDGATLFKDQRSGRTIETNSPLLVAALKMLEREWPQAIAFQTLLDACQAKHKSNPELVAALPEQMLRIAANDLVDLRTHRFRVAAKIADRPVASPLARLQAKLGLPLTTLLLGRVTLSDPRAREFMAALDGTRSVVQLTKAFGPGARGELDKVCKLGLLI